ncbi:MAG: GNAT family N-acetyltransferase [bacterium]|nr:GNAT family N-acetyltransferase [bacterium]
MKLILPSTEYKESFLEALEEFRGVARKQDVENSLVKRYSESADFDAFITKLRGEMEGKFLPEGYVPHTVYWLVDGEKFIGWLDIRHRLTEHLREIGGNIGYAIRPTERGKGYGTAILKLALPKARELGIMKIRITCNADNIASAKIIEKNGGVFENTATTDEGVVKRRYWITLK